MFCEMGGEAQQMEVMCFGRTAWRTGQGVPVKRQDQVSQAKERVVSDRPARMFAAQLISPMGGLPAEVAWGADPDGSHLWANRDII